MVQFILGGARSGKSRYAEGLAQKFEAQGKTVFYIATAQASVAESVDSVGDQVDPEMLRRIEQHQADRPQHWQTLETPIKLAERLSGLDHKDHCIMVDCLTLWTLNLIESEVFQSERSRFLALLPNLQAELILVSNEIGLGVVPMGQLTRTFVDELGWLHQDIARVADEVTFVTAGLPMSLKSSIK
ncbi:MAG: adenosylcobinamide kinase/adenosylcobinamide-phosphate guanylyltransferase [Thiomicrorhabdus sp.]|nr:MAG: adenosylcobinamide kinase/adenosylcobinamide-phosphate guanylyltransferase [Thiomicrorhabdus sp.]